jgi:xanthine dehydrogenase molybdopterin-binding subunit B
MNVMQPIDRIRGGVHEQERHESGHKHVTGTARCTAIWGSRSGRMRKSCRSISRR